MAQEGALTRRKEVPGLVVRVSVGDGLGQVVNRHLILLARLHHKVAEGKTPLEGMEEGGEDRSHMPPHPSGPKEPHPPPPPEDPR